MYVSALKWNLKKQLNMLNKQSVYGIRDDGAK